MHLDKHTFQAVIFDMDGVLIDSEPLWKIAMFDVFSALGSTLNAHDFQRTVGLRIDQVVEYWNHEDQWGIDDIHSVVGQIIDRMVELVAENPIPLPGVIDTLNYLSETDVKIGLATSSPQRLIDAVLKYLNIAHYFDAVHSAEFERFGKPHPDVYLKTAASLKINPIHCLVIEDSLNGVISGKAAMMTVVCIPEKTHIPNPKLIVADYHFESMGDFLRDFRA
ncbi:MAG: hexitol phosphatase HxpB [Flavobacteriales bacterium]